MNTLLSIKHILINLNIFDPSFKHKTLACLMCLLLSSATLAQDGTLVRDSVLKAEAGNAAADLQTLAKGQAISLLKRKGGWYLVKTQDGSEGWVKMLAVRFEMKADASSANLSALVRIEGSREAGVATGVRGVADEELAQRDVDAQGQDLVKPLDSFSPTAQEVGRFAEEGQLRSQRVDYIEVEE